MASPVTTITTATEALCIGSIASHLARSMADPSYSQRCGRQAAGAPGAVDD